MTPAEAAIGELINAAMSAERELGCNAGMDEGHSVWQALKAAERHVLSELDALRARCGAAEALLRRCMPRSGALQQDIDAHLKGAGRE